MAPKPKKEQEGVTFINGVGAHATGAITKTGRTNSHTNSARLNERALLAKLQEMVPNMHNEKKLTKLKIIKGVIEYIKDLTNVIDDQDTIHTNEIY